MGRSLLPLCYIVEVTKVCINIDNVSKLHVIVNYTAYSPVLLIDISNLLSIPSSGRDSVGKNRLTQLIQWMESLFSPEPNCRDQQPLDQQAILVCITKFKISLAALTQHSNNGLLGLRLSCFSVHAAIYPIQRPRAPWLVGMSGSEKVSLIKATFSNISLNTKGIDSIATLIST